MWSSLTSTLLSRVSSILVLAMLCCKSSDMSLRTSRVSALLRPACWTVALMVSSRWMAPLAAALELLISWLKPVDGGQSSEDSWLWTAAEGTVVLSPLRLFRAASRSSELPWRPSRAALVTSLAASTLPSSFSAC